MGGGAVGPTVGATGAGARPALRVPPSTERQLPKMQLAMQRAPSTSGSASTNRPHPVPPAGELPAGTRGGLGKRNFGNRNFRSFGRPCGFRRLPVAVYRSLIFIAPTRTATRALV